MFDRALQRLGYLTNKVIKESVDDIFRDYHSYHRFDVSTEALELKVVRGLTPNAARIGVQWDKKQFVNQKYIDRAIERLVKDGRLKVLGTVYDSSVKVYTADIY